MVAWLVRLTLLDWVFGLLVQEGTVGLGAALGLTLPVAGSHIPLSAAQVHVTVDTGILRALSLLPVNAFRLIAEGERLVSEGAIIGSGAGAVEIKITILPGRHALLLHLQ